MIEKVMSVVVYVAIATSITVVGLAALSVFQIVLMLLGFGG